MAATILILNTQGTALTLVRVNSHAQVVRSQQVHLADAIPPAWRALSGDPDSRRVYLLSADNRVFSLPLPLSWQRP